MPLLASVFGLLYHQVLARKSREVAQEESSRHTKLLMGEDASIPPAPQTGGERHQARWRAPVLAD